MGIDPGEWLRLLKEEYFSEYIRSGGSAVKIAVVAPSAAADVLQRLHALAEEHGCLVARVDAARTRVHLIERIFFAVAEQVDWETLTKTYLRRLLERNGIMSEGYALSDIAALAQANGRSRTDLLPEINRLVENAVLRDTGLSKEFRTALAMLCRGCYNPQNVSPTDADVVKQWLLGEKCHLSALKRVQIYQRIGRHNARLLLGSTAAWLCRVGLAGLALLMDLTALFPEEPDRAHLRRGRWTVSIADSAVAAGRRSSTPFPPSVGNHAWKESEAPAEWHPDAELRYTRSALLDAYEVLRQFIDGTDEVESLIVVVVAGPGMLDDPRRSVDSYMALKMRVADEVRDRDRPNPLNALVRLSADGEGGRT